MRQTMGISRLVAAVFLTLTAMCSSGVTISNTWGVEEDLTPDVFPGEKSRKRDLLHYFSKTHLSGTDYIVIDSKYTLALADGQKARLSIASEMAWDFSISYCFMPSDANPRVIDLLTAARKASYPIFSKNIVGNGVNEFIINCTKSGGVYTYSISFRGVTQSFTSKKAGVMLCMQSDVNWDGNFYYSISCKTMPKTVTVTYSPGLRGEGSVLKQPTESGVSVELKGALFTRDGYSQTGWSLDPAGSTLDYALRASYEAEKDLTLYPYWFEQAGAEGPVALIVGGGTSISPGGSLTLTCNAVYANGSIKTVKPYWVTVRGDDYVSISDAGVLTARPYISGVTVSVMAGFADDGAAVTKTVDISIDKEPEPFVMVIPPAGGKFKSSLFDASASRAWGLGISEIPSWISSPVIYAGASYYVTGTPIDIKTSQYWYPLASKLACFSLTARANDTGNPRWWAFPGKDSNGNLLKNFVFLQHPQSSRTVAKLTVSGLQSLEPAEKALYRCAATFSDGKTEAFFPKWSVSSGEAYASIDENGVLTAIADSSVQTVTVLASYTARGVVNTGSIDVVINPLLLSSYTVTYMPGSHGTGTERHVTRTKGTSLELEGAIFTRGGYTQTGWSTTDGGEKAYSLGETYFANEDACLYPYWTPNAPTLASISITGDTSVTSGNAATFTCTAMYSDGSSKTVAPSWTISSGESCATISSAGVLTAKTVTSAQTVTVEASYTDGGVTMTATATVTVNPVPVMPSDSDFPYKVVDGKAVITNYVGAGGTVEIPSVLGGVSSRGNWQRGV